MTRRRQSTRPTRVFIGFTEIAGYYSKLALGLLDHGCSVTVVFLTDPYGYLQADDRFTRPPQPILALLLRSRRDLRPASRVMGVLARAALLGWSLVRCDAYVFASGGTFFRGLDLLLLRLLKKRTLAVFNGSDARPPYLSGIEWVTDGHVDLDGICKRTTATAAHVRRTERGVDAVISHPAYSQLQQQPYFSYLAVGMPVPSLRPHDRWRNGPPLVLHAPSRPLQKGTPQIEAALEQLRSEGIELEYRKLVGLRNDEVLDALLTSDVVVDELYGDTLLGGIGVEGAAAGCAVVVTGYAGAVIEATHSCPLPPIRLLDPDEMLPELRRQLSDPGVRHRSGQDLRSFVETHWSPAAVAGRVLAILDGTADPAWLIDPLDVVYVDGWGVSREVLRHGLATFVERFGRAALQVEHHRALEDALVGRPGGEAGLR